MKWISITNIKVHYQSETNVLLDSKSVTESIYLIWYIFKSKGLSTKLIVCIIYINGIYITVWTYIPHDSIQI